MTQALQTQQNTNKLTRQDQIKPYLLGAQKQITSLLQDEAKAKRFLAASLVVASDNALRNCSPDSIVQALVGVAMSDLNIDKNIGHCYLVPYKDSVQLQIGYKGFIQLLHRAGWLVKAFPVYHCDQFNMAFDGWDNKVAFLPNIDERDEGDKEWVFANLRGIYVVSRHADTKDEYSLFVSKPVIEKLRLTSQNQRATQWTKDADKTRLAAGLPVGIWADWYVEMAQAKAIKKLAKILPIGDARAQTAIYADDKNDVGVVVDYKKTAESGVITEQESHPRKPGNSRPIDDVIDHEPAAYDVVEVENAVAIDATDINQDTGEIIDDGYADLHLAIRECETLSDISRLLREMTPELKARFKNEIVARQAQIKGETA